jgi:ribose 5-phosphate isomerase RpiB
LLLAQRSLPRTLHGVVASFLVDEGEALAAKRSHASKVLVIMAKRTWLALGTIPAWLFARYEGEASGVYVDEAVMVKSGMRTLPARQSN